MKRIMLIISLMVITSASAFSQNIYDSIFVDNRWRTYMTHLPAGYNTSISYPLVFCFHGGQNGAQSLQLGWQAVAYMSELSQKADSAGFIAVYPEGTLINNNRSWNAGLCCPPAMNNSIDDVGFVDQLIETLKNDYSVDSTRIYASGSSNGAMLCFRLACELSHKIAAFATVSAAHEFFPCNPVNKVPVINFHSLVDSAVLYNGGIGNGPSGVNFISQDSTISIWSANNNCASTDTIVNGGTTGYSFIKVHHCDCNVAFDHYVTSDGGHSWPGGNPNNNPVSYQISATYLMWEFFQNYTLGCLNTGVHNIQNNDHLQIYPNPANHQLTVANMPGNFKGSISIYNSLGQMLLTEQKNGSQFSIETGQLNSGIYFIQIKTENGEIITYKFLKQ